MQIQTHKSQKILNKMSTKACLAVSGVLCLAGSIGMTYGFTRASSSEYSLTGNNVTLDGTNNGSTTVALRTSVARTYVAIQGTFSLHEVVESGTTQTSYFSLSGMTRGGSTALNYGTSNGTGIWTPDPGASGMSVAAGGEVMAATYTVDKNTPAGTYKISFSDGIFTYDNNGTDLDEDDTIASDVTITVTRTETNNDDNNDNNNTEPGTGTNTDTNDDDNNTGTNTGTTDASDSSSTDGENNTDSSSDTSATTTESNSDSNLSSGELRVPDTGEMTQDGNGANIAAISIVSVAASVVLLAIVVQTKCHKKVDFGKIRN